MASSFRENVCLVRRQSLFLYSRDWTLNEAAAVSMIQAKGKRGTKERAILLHTYNKYMLTVSCGPNKEAEENIW